MSLLTPGIGIIFWMTLTFLILLFILGKWGWPVVIKGLKKREEEIKKSLESADRAKEEMNNLKLNNDKLLLEAKVERDKILKEAKHTSESIIEDARNKAKFEADKIIKDAREDIENEKQKALVDIKVEVAEISLEIARKVLEQEVKDEKVSKEIISKQMQNMNLG